MTGGKPFVDEKFNIIPINAPIPAPEAPKPAIEKVPPFGEADIFFLSETGTSTLPCLIWPKLKPVPKEMVEKFNHEFYLYCIRKGIDPRDYLFDEMGIAVAGIAIAGFHYNNYKDAYKTPAKQESEKKLNAEYNHQQELAQKKLEATTQP